MAVNLSPVNIPQWFDANGVPLNGGKIYTYVAGSDSVQQTSYTDSTGNTANQNPMILDASGRPTNAFWLTPGYGYHFVVTNAGNTIQWQEDNIFGMTLVSGPTALSQLSDVTLTSPTTGQVLTYNGSKWVNQVGGGGGSVPTWIGRLFSVTTAPMDGNLYYNWNILQDQTNPDVTTNGSTLTLTPAGAGGYYKITILGVVVWAGINGWPSTPSLTTSIGTYMAHANSNFNASNHPITNQNYPNNFNNNPNPGGNTSHSQMTFTDEYLVQATTTVDITPGFFAAMYGGGNGNHVDYWAQITVQLITP